MELFMKLADERPEVCINFISEYYSVIILGGVLCIFGVLTLSIIVDLISYYTRYYKMGESKWTPSKFSEVVRDEELVFSMIIVCVCWPLSALIIGAVLMILSILGIGYIIDMGVKKMIKIKTHQRDSNEPPLSRESKEVWDNL